MTELNNPNLIEAGKATQFGAGQDAKAARAKSKPWSIRNSLNYFAAQEIDPRDEKAIEKLIGDKKMTVAQAIAIKTLARALTGDMRAIIHATENIDGKVPEKHHFAGDPDNHTPIKTISLPPST